MSPAVTNTVQFTPASCFWDAEQEEFKPILPITVEL